jgi:glycosyltransferase involved in cell wall biosynthesis
MSGARTLRILQVSTVDIRGGAEQVALNLSTAYRARGHASSLVVGERRGSESEVQLLPNDAARSPWARFWYGMVARLGSSERGRAVPFLAYLAGALAEPGRRLAYNLGREDFDFPGTRQLLDLPRERPEVVHAHNLHGGYFDLRRLPWLSEQVPLILTLHDAWMLSGHCAHSFGCERWRTGCGRCPDLTIYPAVRRDATAYNWRRKRAIFAGSRLFVATPSRWLMRKVEDSMLAAGVQEARVIPNGIDLTVFRPADRRAARMTLGLPVDRPLIVATGVEAARSEWKDVATLRLALKRLGDQHGGTGIDVLILGSSALTEEVGQTRLRFVPFKSDPRDVAAYLQAADVYVHAARADTFPLAVLEAMACGTPVVASNVDGIPEQFDDGHSGFLIPKGDAAAFATRLQQLLSDKGLAQKLGAAGVERARRCFDLERQVDAYLDWYAELVNGAVERRAS